MSSTERYWQAVGSRQDALLDWVSENVSEAMRQFWEDGEVTSWFDVDDGRFILTIAGHPKPSKDDPSGKHDIYTAKIDIISRLTAWVEDYSYAPRSEAERKEQSEAGKALRALSEAIAKLADEADC